MWDFPLKLLRCRARAFSCSYGTAWAEILPTRMCYTKTHATPRRQQAAHADWDHVASSHFVFPQTEKTVEFSKYASN